LQNAENITLRHGFDQFNSPMVSHNGCKGATKDTKHENKGAKKNSKDGLKILYI